METMLLKRKIAKNEKSGVESIVEPIVELDRNQKNRLIKAS